MRPQFVQAGPLRCGKGMAGKACHAFASTTWFGLTQALDLMESLCRSIVAAFVFLDFSDGDVIDADAAVRASEAMAAELQSASQEERAAFIRTCEREAAAIRSTSGDARMARFIAELPLTTGLVGDGA